mmetsp:Transcript_10647/g.23520  ORF Transcript_10647/g.23520 Transcript_10647/m.23520 type:complete len:564 (-) Transcript_10647:429-2120(-)|eukprot:CAMPEP_0172312476 /NCGR_PEP_ID=MMETSP1058-20130122/17625_1 /TAXON_ID=83371 /ORGANISM="Detonula confervacea, Strain CCMP 353" /LENGTH=563 /DNA_ID=CAMNT_0013025945 /DNA_START=221 /DNA_END=1912 /DNA_ORIENTATION=+
MATEIMSSTAVALTSPNAPLRARRKSAKAAAAFVTAVVKEEMLVPPAPSAGKRSYSRGNSLGSMASSVSTTLSHTSGSLTQVVREVVAKNSKGHPKKKTALSSYAVEYLKAWMMSPDHIEHPYPTEDEKVKIMKDTSIELKQLTNWFVNNRKRYWKPKVEEMRQQSISCNVTLQEMAAAAQAAGGGSVATVARMASEKSNRNSSSAVVSSEGEESSTSTRERNNKPMNNKKRKKYSTLDKEEVASLPAPPSGAGLGMNIHVTNTRTSKKAKEDQGRPQSAVVNPMVSLPLLGIATARTHEDIKAARKMSRIVSGNEESEESDGEENKSQGQMAAPVKAVVSNPLATVAIPPLVLTTMVSSSTLGTVAPTDTANATFATVATDTLQELVPLTADQVADLEYSITTLDAELEENAADTAHAVDAEVSAATICCGGIMPHSCILADPGANNGVAQPCALCSACRDWNMGEFCPWDLTGLLGDISTDMEIPSSSSQDEEEYFTAPSMDGSIESMITKNSTLGDSAASIEQTAMSSNPVPQEISHSTMTRSTSAADFMSSMVGIENWD